MWRHTMLKLTPHTSHITTVWSSEPLLPLPAWRHLWTTPYMQDHAACSVLSSIRDGQTYIRGAIFHPHPNSSPISVNINANPKPNTSPDSTNTYTHLNPNPNPNNRNHNHTPRMENSLELVQLFVPGDGKYLSLWWKTYFNSLPSPHHLEGGILRAKHNLLSDTIYTLFVFCGIFRSEIYSELLFTCMLQTCAMTDTNDEKRDKPQAVRSNKTKLYSREDDGKTALINVRLTFTGSNKYMLLLSTVNFVFPSTDIYAGNLYFLSPFLYCSRP